MTEDTKKILKNAMELPPIEKANLVKRLLASLEEPDKHIDSLWRKEVEKRVKAYKAGEIKSVTLKEVVSKYVK